ncbi:MAG: hypothetical protein Q9162_005247 [Coniocarpon cinnabarinum]
MAIRQVAIIGASGTLGPAVLEALVRADCFTIKVLARQSSSATFPSVSQTVRIPDDGGNEDQIASALQGADALVVTMPAKRSEDMARLANACIKAGVRRMIPADFGSVDSTDTRCLDLVPLYGEKTKAREYLQRLSSENGSFTWTSLVCGHFFDHGLSDELLGFNLKLRTATIFGDGNVKWCTSTLSHIGEAVVKILQKEDATINQMMYMQSFYISQNELLATLENVSGEKFKCSKVDAEEYIRTQKQQMDAGNPNSVERLVSVLGITRGDWHNKVANDLLELSIKNPEATIGEQWLRQS